jgi:hypothetical protein
LKIIVIQSYSVIMLCQFNWSQQKYFSSYFNCIVRDILPYTEKIDL